MNDKEEPGAGAAERFAHEERIIARLAGVDGVACLLAELEGRIELADHDGLPLAQILRGGPLEVPALLELALHLARTLAAMHRHGVLHQNINPRHILMRGSQRPPLLVDFHLATTFAAGQPGFTHHREIRGNLTYLAPEHTGRTGRGVDLRADLYSLGATLYESATGRPPFEAQDPLQLLHDHLASLPTPPRQLRGELPAAVSEIILRLLEKEPERRYQSADGLAHDLARIERALTLGEPAPVRLGEQDFPLKLSAPARLVGRDHEISALRQALHESVQGRRQIVLVAGAPGVGKTSLINELRPMVTSLRGWFVSGKFDQYRHDAPSATTQAFRALGRLLLAEPEAQLAVQRERILRALGVNAGLICATPEFALMLGPQPEVPSVEPVQAEERLLATVVSLLRAIVSPERPLVMVLDDLQWGGALSIRFIEAVLDSQDLGGLLLVGSYRDAEVDTAHPLGALLGRLNRDGHALAQLRLTNLPAEDLGALLREMMRLPSAQATALAQAVGEHTGGNPFDTVELLNALRRDGALRPGSDGWAWDATALRRYVGQSGVLDLLAARTGRLPPASQTLLHAMACLGGQVPLSLLCAATGLAPGELSEQLAPPLEDGLLVIEPTEDSTLRMRHDRVQQAVYGALDPARRRALHLGLARRLADSARFSTAAVQQYLPAVQDIVEAEECRGVARLLREVAINNRNAANYVVTQRLLAAAMSLASRQPTRTEDDESLLATLEIDNHMALCSLGRFEEADALYRAIEGRKRPVQDWLDAACAQLDSLSSRSHTREAVMLGVSLLRQLGSQVPADFAAANIEQGLADWGQWIRQVDLGRDARPYTGNQRSTAQARLINRLAYPAYFTDLRIMGWLILEGQDLWIRHGPSAELVPALAHLGAVAIGLKQDYRTAYYGSRHVVDVSQTRGWEPGTSEARFLFANHTSHWFEPLEHSVRQLHQAREGMMRNGELQNASFCHRSTTTALLDCSPSMKGWGEDIDSGLVLALRLRHDYIIAMLSIERQLLCRLQGIAHAPADLADDTQSSIRRQASMPAVSVSMHFCGALMAALFGDLPALAGHAAAAMKFAKGLAHYRGAQARLLHAFSLAQQARAATGAEREALLAELDASCQWLAQRAADAPENFLHLLQWIEAERAWTLGDFRTAAAQFDAALCQVESLIRPWHHGMITERTGLFHLEQGMSKTGRQFIAQARELYRHWGAQAKVRHLEATHAFLNTVSAPAPAPASGADDAQAATSAVDTIDTLAILRASQTLSSETSLARLKTRVADVMGALTGATTVRFALWDDELRDWILSDGDGDGSGARRIAARDTDASGLLPLSAIRYAERTREPLLVEDATSDDRFARDPYLAGLGHCSLLVVPILNQGSLRAMLLLENRLSRNAFSTSRLDAVMLIAGQLAVSLENALLYDKLEQRVQEQTGALREAQAELVDAARRAGMAEIATNVLHNVGNILNSVNTSANLVSDKLRASRGQGLSRVRQLLEEHAGDMGEFLTQDAKGRMLPAYLITLAQTLAEERQELIAELGHLTDSVDHIKGVVATQQSYAGRSSLLEPVQARALVEDALRMNADSLGNHNVVVVKELTDVPLAHLDKTRVMQILVNLISNAKQAMEDLTDRPRRLTLQLDADQKVLRVRVKDEGRGIAPENLARIFSHGFTTRKEGHGFGLHSCALAAVEMGGTLVAHSDGPGLGATFTLELPIEPGAALNPPAAPAPLSGSAAPAATRS